MNKVRVSIPASTTNLGPGFDVLGMALQLYNIVEVEVPGRDLCIEVEGEGASALSKNEDNLVYQAVRVVFDKIGKTPPPMRIKLINNIPLARGLGSSGTAIIGGLISANVISNAGLTSNQILNLAAELDGHPDNVAASIFGGVVIACPTEEGVCYMKFVPPKPIDIVVIVPDFPLLTSEARAILPKSVDLSSAVFNIGRASLLIASLATGDFRFLGMATEDKLHQPYRAKLIPGLHDVFQSAKSSDENIAVAISGAGSSIIALCCNNKSTEVAENMRQAFLKHNINSRAMILNIDERGTTVTKDGVTLDLGL